MTLMTLPWRILAAAGLLVLGLVFGFIAGKQTTAWRLNADRANDHAMQAQAVADALQRQRNLAQIVVTDYIDRVHVIVARGETIVRRVPVYVTRQADAGCTVPRGFVRVHNAAAEGFELPATATDAVDAASGVALSAVAATVSGNYTACRVNAARLIALQDWARLVSGSAP